jgi:hypothetical protein
MGEVIDLTVSRSKITEAIRDAQIAKIAIGELNLLDTTAEQEDVLPDVLDRKPRPFETEIPQPEGDMN